MMNKKLIKRYYVELYHISIKYCIRNRFLIFDQFRLVPQKVPLWFRFVAEKYFLRNSCYFFDSKSPIFVFECYLTEIRF